MKSNSISFVLLLFILSISSSFAQKIEEKLLVKKWTTSEIVTHMDIKKMGKAKEQEMLKMMKEVVLDFKEDHTFIGRCFMPIPASIWKMEGEMIHIVGTGKGESLGQLMDMRIKELTSDYMIVEFVDGEMSMMTLKMK